VILSYLESNVPATYHRHHNLNCFQTLETTKTRNSLSSIWQNRWISAADQREDRCRCRGSIRLQNAIVFGFSFGGKARDPNNEMKITVILSGKRHQPKEHPTLPCTPCVMSLYFARPVNIPRALLWATVAVNFAFVVRDAVRSTRSSVDQLSMFQPPNGIRERL
jgi:hypothetical protein